MAKLWILAGALMVVSVGASLSQNSQNMQGYGGAQLNAAPGALSPTYAPFHGVAPPTLIPTIRRQTLGDVGLPGGVLDVPATAARNPTTCPTSDCATAGGLTPFGASRGGLTPFGAKLPATQYGASQPTPVGGTQFGPYGAPLPAPVGAAQFTPYGTPLPAPGTSTYGAPPPAPVGAAEFTPYGTPIPTQPTQ